MNPWFKLAQTFLFLVALGQTHSFCHVMIMHHIVHCIDCVPSLLSVVVPSRQTCSNDEFDDTDEELYYLLKCQASKTPLFIPIQSHSLASALFYYIRTTTIHLLHDAVVEPLFLCMTCHCHSKQMKPTSMSRSCLSPVVPTHSCLLSCPLMLRVELGLIHRG